MNRYLRYLTAIEEAESIADLTDSTESTPSVAARAAMKVADEELEQAQELHQHYVDAAQDVRKVLYEDLTYAGAEIDRLRDQLSCINNTKEDK